MIYLLLLILMMMVGYLGGDKLILKVLKIRPQKNCVSGELFDLVSNISFKLGVIPPKIYFYKLPMVNTFIVKGIKDNSSIMIFHENITSLFNKEEIKIIVFREILKTKDKSILSKNFETIVYSLIFYILDSVEKINKNIFMKQEKSIFSKFKIVFWLILKMIVYSFSFFYIYLVVKLFDTNKTSKKKDDQLLGHIKDQESFIVVLERLYKINKNYVDSHFVGKNFFISTQGQYFNSFYKLVPHLIERYQNR